MRPSTLHRTFRDHRRLHSDDHDSDVDLLVVQVVLSTNPVGFKPSLPPRKVSFRDTTVSHADTMYSPFSGGYSSGMTTSASTSNSQGGCNSTEQNFSSQFSQIYRDLTRFGLNHTDALKCANDAQLYTPQSFLPSQAPQTPNFQTTPLSL